MKISQIEILKKIYSEIVIPEAVYKEIEAGKHKEFYRDLSRIDWIKIQSIKDKHSIDYFLDLDAVEAEAIILATEIGADLIIIDEKLGRLHAKKAGIKVTGTIGVLIKARKMGLIPKIKPLLIQLTKKNVWISDVLISQVCKTVDE
jgi:predicted nucleic acid-binding protein